MSRSCDFCIFKPFDANQLTARRVITTEQREACDRILNCYLSEDPRAGRIVDRGNHAHPYTQDGRYEWDEEIPLRDLQFLHQLVYVLDHIIAEKSIDENRLPVFKMLKWYLHIRCAYQRALGRFLIRIRVNGLEQIRVESAQPRRERRIEVLHERLYDMSTVIPADSPKLQESPDCMICQESLVLLDSEQAIKLPCGHILGLECLKIWIEGWDRESRLRVCTLCDADFNITRSGNAVPGDEINLPGFELPVDGRGPNADEMRVFLDERIADQLAVDGDSTLWNESSPWWMCFLRQYASPLAAPMS